MSQLEIHQTFHKLLAVQSDIKSGASAVLGGANPSSMTSHASTIAQPVAHDERMSSYRPYTKMDSQRKISKFLRVTPLVFRGVQIYSGYIQNE